DNRLHDRDHQYQGEVRHSDHRQGSGRRLLEYGNTREWTQVPTREMAPDPQEVLTPCQLKVFAMLFDLKVELQRVAAIVDLGNTTCTSFIKRLASESNLKSFEQSIKDEEKSSICVLQLSRVWGSSVRDCVNKVINRIMLNVLMAKFIMRGGAQLQKKPFGATSLYNIIQ
ncbi:serine arginine-rich splicing factor 4-like isoform X14, partial [Clarias magur]